MARNVTLFDLVSAVAEHACSDNEVIATVGFGSGQKLIAFAHEIELVSEELAA